MQATLHQQLTGTSRRQRRETVVKAALRASAVVSILISVLIVFSLVREAWTFVSQVEWSSLVADGWFPRRGLYDVRTLLVGSVLVTAIAMAVAAPLGLGTAIFLAEYAPPRVRRTLKPVLEVLAGIPTVVFGFFAISFVTPNILRPLLGDIGIFNALSAGLVIGILIIPIVASLSEDALSAVPQAMRDGALALGATRTSVARKVVLPAALSGVIASFVLALSRGIGETMVAVIAAGSIAQLTADPTEPMQTMTAFIAQAASGDQPTGSLGYNTLFAVGALLFVITLFINVVSIRLVRRFREVYE